LTKKEKDRRKKELNDQLERADIARDNLAANRIAKEIVKLDYGTYGGIKETIVIDGDLTIRPVKDYILVKREGYDPLSSVIIIPEVYKNKHNVEILKGVVISMGVPSIINVGDVVYFNYRDGTNLKINNQDHLFIQEKDILMTIQGD